MHYVQYAIPTIIQEYAVNTYIQYIHTYTLKTKNLFSGL